MINKLKKKKSKNIKNKYNKKNKKKRNKIIIYLKKKPKIILNNHKV